MRLTVYQMMKPLLVSEFVLVWELQKQVGQMLKTTAELPQIFDVVKDRLLWLCKRQLGLDVDYLRS